MATELQFQPPPRDEDLAQEGWLYQLGPPEPCTTCCDNCDKAEPCQECRRDGISG